MIHGSYYRVLYGDVLYKEPYLIILPKGSLLNQLSYAGYEVEAQLKDLSAEYPVQVVVQRARFQVLYASCTMGLSSTLLVVQWARCQVLYTSCTMGPPSTLLFVQWARRVLC